MMKKLIISATLVSCVTGTPSALAQEGTSHSAVLIGLSSGGCQNLTGTVPPSYPGYPGAIPCTERFENRTLIQGETPSPEHFVGSSDSELHASQIQDALGAVYTLNSRNSVVRYGLGNDNYSEFFQDGASRQRWYELKVPNLVDAHNANPDFRTALAFQRVIDGSALSFLIDGGSDLLALPAGHTSRFEIIPVDPDGSTTMSNPNFNPYTFEWVAPRKPSTPHISIPSAIRMLSTFDTSEARWRYFIEADGPTLGEIGKYIVYFELRENSPRQVRYQSQVEGVIVINAPRLLRATLTIVYGIEQCASAAGLSFPSMNPLLDVHSRVLQEVKKDFKRLSKMLKGSATRGTSLRFSLVKIRRANRRAQIFNDESRLMNAEAIALQLSALDVPTQTTTVLRLQDTARATTISGRNASPYSVRRISRALSALMKRPEVVPGTNERRGITKTLRKYKKLISEADSKLTEYLTVLLETERNLAELRVNSARCNEITR